MNQPFIFSREVSVYTTKTLFWGSIAIDGSKLYERTSHRETRCVQLISIRATSVQILGLTDGFSLKQLTLGLRKYKRLVRKDGGESYEGTNCICFWGG